MKLHIRNKKTTAIITTIGLAMSAGFIIGIGGWFGGGASIPADTMTRGLVGYWSFDEGMGDTAYNAAATGSVNKGTLGGDTGASAMPDWTTGKIGGALEFNGTSDYVDCGSDTSLDITDAVTIEAWVKPILTGDWAQTIVRNADVVYMGDVLIDGTMRFGHRDSDSGWRDVRTTTGCVQADVWQYLVFVRDSALNVYLYINGNLIKTAPIPGPVMSDPTQPTWIGKNEWNLDYFHGTIDEVRIYNRALSAEEIRYHYNRGGPVAEWKFNEGSGDTAFDTSGNLHHAAVHCPEGYIPVPGNSTYGTQDFCVMKYEAKCVGSAEGNTCDDANDTPISQVANKPWRTTISQIEAIAACQRAGGHLITNNEWMTIARNLEQVNSNWCELDGSGCGNTPGTKYLAAGHNDAAWVSPYNYCLAAYSNDTLSCYGTKGTGSDYNPTDTSACGAETGTQKRTHTLSNGEVIWDLSGNVWEWTNDTLDCSEHPVDANGGSEWLEFTAVADYKGLDDGGNATTTKYVEPSDATWNSSQRVGKIYTDAGDTGNRAFWRGGSWPDISMAGAFSLRLVIGSSVAHLAGGFRCARYLSR